MYLETRQCTRSALINMHWLEESRRHPSHSRLQFLLGLVRHTLCWVLFAARENWLKETFGFWRLSCYVPLYATSSHRVLHNELLSNPHYVHWDALSFNVRIACNRSLLDTRCRVAQNNMQLQTDRPAVSRVFGAKGVGVTCITHSISYIYSSG